MPLYNYRCETCGLIRSSFAKVEDQHVTLDCLDTTHREPEQVCQLTRIPSAPAVIIPRRHRAA